MKFREHEENRHWIIGAIDDLERFITTDADFRGNKAHELKAIAIQRRFVEDGRYRVVFLGTFNVGKSTGINSFLGGGYLFGNIPFVQQHLSKIILAMIIVPGLIAIAGAWKARRAEAAQAGG